MGPRILVVDNYDSFVYNLVQYLGELGADPIVHRHDEISLAEMIELRPDGVPPLLFDELDAPPLGVTRPVPSARRF